MSINDLTRIIIGCAYKVHNTLGSGFLEEVYENSLKIELEKLCINVKQQEPISAGRTSLTYHWIRRSLANSTMKRCRWKGRSWPTSVRCVVLTFVQ